MKKLCFVIIFITIGLLAKGNEHNFSLGTSIGILYGQSEEIVYRNRDSDEKLSQLLWDLKPLVYAGANLHYHWQNPFYNWGLFSDVLFKFGLPGNTGYMEDRDWMDTQYANFLTHYSISDNKTESAVLIDFNAGITFNVYQDWLLKFFVSYSYMNFSWTASGGSVLHPYPPDNPNIDHSRGSHGYFKTPIDVVTYKQSWNIVSLGASFYGAFNPYFNIDISIKLSPLISCMSEDNHILINWIMTDYLYGGFFIEPNITFSFTPNDFFTLSFSAKYRSINNTRGDSLYNRNNSFTLYRNIGGAGFSAFDAGIVARLNLGF